MKDVNTEIENILNESPLVNKSKPKKIKKLKGSQKKKIIIMVVLVIVVVGGFILIQNITSNEKPTTETVSNTDLINSIKQQIINKGYAEVGDLTLAPYIP